MIWRPGERSRHCPRCSRKVEWFVRDIVNNRGTSSQASSISTTLLASDTGGCVDIRSERCFISSVVNIYYKTIPIPCFSPSTSHNACSNKACRRRQGLFALDYSFITSSYLHHFLVPPRSPRCQFQDQKPLGMHICCSVSCV